MFNSKTANQHLSTIAERITEMPFEPEIFNNTERHKKGMREREKWNVIMICIKLLNINTLVSIDGFKHTLFFGWFIFITFARYLKEFAFFVVERRTKCVCKHFFMCVISLANFKDFIFTLNLF